MKDSTCSRTEYGKKLLTALFWIGAWQLIYVIVGREYIIPSPLHTLKLLFTMLFTAEFYENAVWTMGRVLGGMILSFVLGAISAVAACVSSAVRRILAGPVAALKSTPVMSVILLAILALPTDGVPVFVCFLMCYPVVYTNLLAGLDSVDDGLIEMCQVYEIRGKRRFQALYWPSIRPFTRAALTLITGLSWKTVVASEVFAVPRYSMGYHLLYAKTVLAADQLFAWTIAIVMLSVLFEKAVKRLISREWGPGFQSAFCREDGGSEEGATPCTVELRGVSKAFGELELYRDFSMEIPAGEITAIVGPSGCGKTTLLRMIAGLELPDHGEIIHRGERTGQVSCVFQEDRLLPWMTVRENLRLVAGADAVDTVLRMTELSDFGDYLPGQLSGGMRRRVAMGRALVYDGSVTLMDEPFTGLDPELKRQLRRDIGALWRSQGRTVVFITHDRQDAEVLADHIFALDGRPVTAEKWK